jgi:hypothetical protein
LALCGTLSLPPLAHAADFRLQSGHQFAVVHERNGTYHIGDKARHLTAMHVKVAANVKYRWIASSDYQLHRVRESAFEDALGKGN